LVECTFPRVCPGKTARSAPLSGEFSPVAVAGKQDHGGLVAKATCRGGRNFRQEGIAGDKPGVTIRLSTASLTVFSLRTDFMSWKPSDQDLIDSMLVQTKLLPAETLAYITRLRDEQIELDETHAAKLLAQSEVIFSRAVSILGSA
jgi:hypothetical protein